MGLKDQILADVKLAMKQKEQDKLGALRYLQAAIKNKEIELRPNQITEQDVMAVLKKLVKQHRDSIQQYQAAGRLDLVEKENNELLVVECYLPNQMPRDKIEKLVGEVIVEMGASTVKDMGRVMKEVVARSAGAADNKTISEIVKSKLNT